MPAGLSIKRPAHPTSIVHSSHAAVLCNASSSCFARWQVHLAPAPLLFATLPFIRIPAWHTGCRDYPYCFCLHNCSCSYTPHMNNWPFIFHKAQLFGRSHSKGLRDVQLSHCNVNFQLDSSSLGVPFDSL